MINVLIVDDNDRKRDRIAEVVAEAVGGSAVEVTAAVSAAEAARMLESKRYDLLVLDLNLPVKKGDTPKRDGGLKLLKQLTRGGPRFQVPSHILGLTAFDELAEEFENEFYEEAWQLIRYEDSSDEWAKAIQNKMLHIAAASSREAEDGYGLDLAIITALKPIELDAVLQLDAKWKPEKMPGDDTYYYRGVFARGTAKLQVVAAAAIEMGMPAAAALSIKMIQRFRPRYLAMAGITAGVGLNFGDVVVAEQSWDYGSGKVKTTAENTSLFSPAPNYIPMNAGLKEKAEYFVSRRKDVLAAIQARWQGNPVHTVLAAKLGPVASGAAVVENEASVTSIQAVNRKLIGIEMETYGVYLAARIAPEPRPLALSAKSVCDFGVPPKTDEYQRYAAFTRQNGRNSVWVNRWKFRRKRRYAHDLLRWSASRSADAKILQESSYSSAAIPSSTRWL